MNRAPRVIIVGGGPAGAAAAIKLATGGAAVTIIDKSVFPRDKCCGDGLTAGALRHLEELGVDPAAVPSWKPVGDVVISSPQGRIHRLPLPPSLHGESVGQFAAVATRADLDAAVLARAREAGATVHEGTELISARLREDRVEVTASSGGFEADWLIGADGMWSPTRKALGLGTPGYLGEWHAFRQYWRNVSPQAQNELFVWFEPDVLPGYVWSFPLADGRANVGFGILRGTRPTGEMKRIWPAILERPHIRAVLGADAEPDDTHKAWPIPARVGDLPLAAHRTLFVGDAAAACDPLTGEGIGQAFQTGIAAAEAILGGGAVPAVTRRYRDDVDQNLRVDMAFAGQLGAILANPTAAEASLAAAGATAWTRRNFVRWLFEDYPRAVLGTPGRWRRDLFTQPGAYTRPIRRP